MELYKKLLPSRVYAAYKTGTSHQINTICRMCGKVSKSLAHVLAECSSLALAKYMDKHNAARKVLLFEMLRDFKLADSVPPWYSRVEPKRLYESENAQAYWDVPVYAEHAFVRDNRIDPRFVDHKAMRVLAVEMSCPWLGNRAKKASAKNSK